MRIALAMIFCSLPLCGAFAHTLDPDAGFEAQLGHQLTGAHHWPLLVLLAYIALVCCRPLRRRYALHKKPTEPAGLRVKSHSR
jgi:hypothetical protein